MTHPACEHPLDCRLARISDHGGCTAWACRGCGVLLLKSAKDARNEFEAVARVSLPKMEKQ